MNLKKEWLKRRGDDDEKPKNPPIKPPVKK